MNIQTFGSPSQPPMLFLHGWPDTAELWTEQIAFFEKKYFCLAVTLPQFEHSSSAGWGYDFIELSQLIVDLVQAELSPPHQPIILVGHDWGAFLAYRIEKTYPEWVDKIITMDVGGHLKPETWGHRCFLITYQWYLILAFLLGKLSPRLGNMMSQKFAALARAPKADQTHSEMNYLYLYFWRAVLCKKYSKNLLKRYTPVRPLLYLYGKKKKYPFHSKKWETLLESLPGCNIVCMEKSDHWLMVREPVKTRSEIEKWLSSFEDAGNPK